MYLYNNTVEYVTVKQHCCMCSDVYKQLRQFIELNPNLVRNATEVQDSQGQCEITKSKTSEQQQQQQKKLEPSLNSIKRPHKNNNKQTNTNSELLGGSVPI